MNKKVLIIEDDTELSELLHLILEDSGCQPKFINGSDYLQSVIDFNPSAILLDYLMPNVGGNIICCGIKNDERTKQIPVIMISAASDLDEVALACGANGWISKPFDIAALELTLFKWMEYANKQELELSGEAILSNRSAA